tara:strand:+ start:366 stop:569 length:204 start_codon:yes stop_codon:yes gene_type:complete
MTKQETIDKAVAKRLKRELDEKDKEIEYLKTKLDFYFIKYLESKEPLLADMRKKQREELDNFKRVLE